MIMFCALAACFMLGQLLIGGRYAKAFARAPIHGFIDGASIIRRQRIGAGGCADERQYEVGCASPRLSCKPLY